MGAREGTRARPELTTVANDEAVVHVGAAVRRYRELRPGAAYALDGLEFRTLPERGALLATFATVNDVHFGELECGRLESLPALEGPVHRSAPGEDPYPEVMSRGAIGEIAALDPDAVLVKGDLTSRGTREEYAHFRAHWEGAFSERLHVVRGNHDVAAGEDFAADACVAVELPGARLALLDTTVPGRAGGRVSADQLEWLGDLAAAADRPVLVFGHHHVWDPASAERPDDYFGIRPEDSERLIERVAASPRIAGYFAGHTHRNRTLRIAATGAVPWVEVACVKDFPGSWAEYRVYEGGVLQIHRRISTPEALDWSERTRDLYAFDYVAYALGTLEERCFAVCET